MKLAYKIITPLLAISAILMGVMLKLFYFAIGSLDETIDSLVTIAEYFGVQTVYEFSAVELVQMLLTGSQTTSDAGTLLEIINPIIPQLIAFFIFLMLTLFTFVIIGAISLIEHALSKSLVIISSAAGIVFTFICILVSNSAFAVITSGEISINDLIALYTDSTWMQLVTLILSVTQATLSAGFYALFGMFILIIIWTIVANAFIKNPIEKKRKAYKRNSLSKKLKVKFSR